MIIPRIDALTQALHAACDEELRLHRRMMRACPQTSDRYKARRAFKQSRDMVVFFTRAIERTNGHRYMGESMGEIEASTLVFG